MNLTAMEERVLEEYRKKFMSNGFPEISNIRASLREQTGAGRYTTLVSRGRKMTIPDGALYVGEASHIELQGVEDGLQFQLFVKDGSPHILEFFTIGFSTWDGSEVAWKLVVH